MFNRLRQLSRAFFVVIAVVLLASACGPEAVDSGPEGSGIVTVENVKESLEFFNHVNPIDGSIVYCVYSNIDSTQGVGRNIRGFGRLGLSCWQPLQQPGS